MKTKSKRVGLNERERNRADVRALFSALTSLILYNEGETNMDRLRKREGTL